MAASNLQRFRVPAGFVAAGLFLLISRPHLTSLALGAPLVLAGLFWRTWAAGHLRKIRAVTRSGPYARSRNPLYFGSALVATGLAIQSGLIWLLPVLALLFGLVYIPVMRREERELLAVLGSAYEDYLGAVPRFLPRLGPTRMDSGRFSPSLAIANREYNAWAGAVLVELFLIGRATRPDLWLW